MRVYVAGPYTLGDPVINVRKAIEAGQQLLEAGHSPYVPHLTMFWHFLFPADPSVWYELDNEWLAVSEALVRLPGESVGADNEATLAAARFIPVFYSVDEFLGWVATHRGGK